MAASDISQGYICEFVDPVADEYYCKKCTLVARRLTISSCCGESFCHACVAGTVKQKLPCPACGNEQLNSFEHVKYQQQIDKLKVYCSMKGRGCCWLGILEQLDTHLDPEQDDCQYVDTRCPLNCQQTIPKNKVEQHMAEECAKRDFVCKHCSFKAAYEDVMDKHLPECSYVPLQCPNVCGVTCERGFMEDHMKTCRLEEITCEFSDVGCKQSFIREKQEEHVKENIQLHLSLTASQAIATHEHQHVKLREMKEKLEESMQGQHDKLMEDIRDLRSVIGQQKKKLIGQDNQIKQKFDIMVVIVIIMGLVLAYQQNRDLTSLVQEELQEGQKAHSDKLANLSKQTTDLSSLLSKLTTDLSSLGKELEEQLLAYQQNRNLSSHVLEELQGQKALSDKLANLSEPTTDLSSLLSKQTTDLSSLTKELEEQKGVHDLSDQLEKLQKQDKIVSNLVEKLKEGNNHTIQYLDVKTNRLILKTVRTFEMKKFNEKNSPFMYTHSCGYKFFLRIDAGGSAQYGVEVALYAAPGEFDDVLQWPARVMHLSM